MLVAIHLAQAIDQARNFFFDAHWRKDKVICNRGGRLAQLVAHDLVHAIDLLIEALAEMLVPSFTEQRAHRRERRLEAVRQVVERVAIAIRPGPLGIDQQIHVAGNPGQLGRKPAGK